MIRVVAHDPAWVTQYELEANRIATALGAALVRVHHIGSTAVASTLAKPIIDVLLEVTSLTALDERTPAMEALGYEAKGEFGIAGRRYFRLNDRAGTRTHHVHAFEAGSKSIVRHLAFRDYLTAHSAIAREYGELKVLLALAHPDNMAAYVNGKDAFVKEHEARAVEWSSAAAGSDAVRRSTKDER